jgi:putative colanic acid biosynthesis UDP-glucose lipid carrier transferase
MGAVADRVAHPPASSKLKRLVDVVGAGFGLVFLAPFLLLLVLVIRLESPGPALFRQRRKGRGGVPFVIYKFRTLRCLEDGPEIVQVEQDDRRLTRLGGFLRRSSIDELPQLLNVLKGNMSLVGPRPHALAHDEFYGAAIENYDARFLARPGISGLAQVSGLRGATPNIEWMAARVALDLEYIRHWSLGLDIRILLQTLVAGPFDPAAF